MGYPTFVVLKNEGVVSTSERESQNEQLQREGCWQIKSSVIPIVYNTAIYVYLDEYLADHHARLSREEEQEPLHFLYLWAYSQNWKCTIRIIVNQPGWFTDLLRVEN